MIPKYITSKELELKEEKNKKIKKKEKLKFLNP